MRARRWLALAALWLGWSRMALAEPKSEPEPQQEAVRFQYAAPGACPDAASFVARVRQRTARGREAEPGELARTFNIDVVPDGPGFVGSIAFLDDGGAKVSRRVGGEQCEAVVDSLALITALALDATLPEQPAPGEMTNEPAPREPPPPAPSPPAERRAPLAPHTLPAPPAPRRLKSARLGITGAYDSAIDAFPFGILAQLDWRSGWSLRTTAHYASSELTVDEGRRAELRVIGLEASGCYLVFAEDGLALSPCLGLDLGSLRARGEKSERLTRPDSKTIFWASAGPELRVAWQPALPVWIELRGMLGFPLVSKGFELERPQKLAYEVPRFTQAVGVATGVRFW